MLEVLISAIFCNQMLNFNQPKSLGKVTSYSITFIFDFVTCALLTQTGISNMVCTVEPLHNGHPEDGRRFDCISLIGSIKTNRSVILEIYQDAKTTRATTVSSVSYFPYRKCSSKVSYFYFFSW